MTIYLSIEEVLEVHDLLIERYGGISGLRDKNLLYSAIETPKVVIYGQEMYPTIFDKAAAYLYHIVCNHPFNDANKRTGSTVTRLFLKVNGIKLSFNPIEYEELVVSVAQGKVTKQEIADFFKAAQCN
ncbi:MAG: doc [Chlamydiales bacterium]|jgi:death-on-curing protein|nr:doc [Chlamydiales bacterium]